MFLFFPNDYHIKVGRTLTILLRNVRRIFRVHFRMFRGVDHMNGKATTRFLNKVINEDRCFVDPFLHLFCRFTLFNGPYSMVFHLDGNIVHFFLYVRGGSFLVNGGATNALRFVKGQLIGHIGRSFGFVFICRFLIKRQCFNYTIGGVFGFFGRFSYVRFAASFLGWLWFFLCRDFRVEKGRL